MTGPGANADIRRSPFVFLCKELRRNQAIGFKQGCNSSRPDTFHQIGQPRAYLILEKRHEGPHKGVDPMFPDTTFLIVRTKHDRVRIGLRYDKENVLCPFVASQHIIQHGRHATQRNGDEPLERSFDIPKGSCGIMIDLAKGT
eukprot:scaffold12005_cov212-Amphora_coffeaeformis.AAC.7